jgi:hypothetical protein
VIGVVTRGGEPGNYIDVWDTTLTGLNPLWFFGWNSKRRKFVVISYGCIRSTESEWEILYCISRSISKLRMFDSNDITIRNELLSEKF